MNKQIVKEIIQDITHRYPNDNVIQNLEEHFSNLELDYEEDIKQAKNVNEHVFIADKNLSMKL